MGSNGPDVLDVCICGGCTHGSSRQAVHLHSCADAAGIPPPEGSDDAQLLTMSTLNEEGVMNVKQVACNRLLSSRVETKLQVRLVLLLLNTCCFAPAALPCLSTLVYILFRSICPR